MEVRQSLKKREILGLPLLPRQNEAKPPQWLDLKLKAQGKETTVKIRGDNLYVVGYQTQETPPKWYELLKNTKYITGATPLTFGDSYNDFSRAAGLRITQVPLSKSEFIKAVTALAGPKPSDEASIAKAVMVVSQMVSEACRFVYIADYFANNLNNEATRLEEWMFHCLVRKWKDFSLVLLCYDKHKAPEATATDPRSSLGVVLNTKLTECGEDCDDEEPDVIDLHAHLHDVVKSATNDPLLAPPPANYSMPRAGDADDRAVV